MADPIRKFLDQHLILLILPIIFLGTVVLIAVLADEGGESRSVEEIHVNGVGCIVISEGEAIAVDCDWGNR